MAERSRKTPALINNSIWWSLTAKQGSMLTVARVRVDAPHLWQPVTLWPDVFPEHQLNCCQKSSVQQRWATKVTQAIHEREQVNWKATATCCTQSFLVRQWEHWCTFENGCFLMFVKTSWYFNMTWVIPCENPQKDGGGPYQWTTDRIFLIKAGFEQRTLCALPQGCTISSI